MQAWSPVLDVAQDARWGRCEETFGEDPVLVSQIGGCLLYTSVTAATNFVNYKDVSANETRRVTEFLAKAMKRPYAQAITAHEEEMCIRDRP